MSFHMRLTFLAMACSLSVGLRLDDDEEEVEYILGEDGANTCPVGSSKVESLDECKAASKALKFDFSKTLAGDNLPGGCYQGSGTEGCSAGSNCYRGNFNSLSGSGAADRRPICKQACQMSLEIKGRTPSDGTNNGIEEGVTLPDCKTKCLAEPQCLGIMYKPEEGNKCVLLDRTYDAEYKSDRVDTDETVVSNKVCKACHMSLEIKGRSPGDAGEESVLTEEGVTLPDCKTKCLAEPRCKGMQYKPDVNNKCVLLGRKYDENYKSDRVDTEETVVSNKQGICEA